MNKEEFEECCETDCKELVTNVFGTNAGDFIIHRPFCKKHSKQFERRLDNMEMEKKIKLAKKIAKEDYENYMEKIGSRNTGYIRKWREVKRKDKVIAYALTGTPDKAFVFVIEGKVLAIRQNGTTIKEF